MNKIKLPINLNLLGMILLIIPFTSSYSLTLDEIEKKEHELRLQKEELLKKQKATLKEPVHESRKATRTINILQNKITELVKEKQKKKPSTEDQINNFISGLKKRNPNLNQEQIDRIRHAYEDTLLEKETAKETTGNDIQKAPTLRDLKITTPNSQAQTRISKSMEELVKRNSKHESNTLEEPDNSELSKEAKKTLVSLEVKPGDTLSDIARRNYNDSSMYMAIYHANKDKLSSPHLIPKGVVLRVPLFKDAKKYKKNTQSHSQHKTYKKPITRSNKDHQKIKTDSYKKWLRQQDQIRANSLRRWEEQQRTKQQIQQRKREIEKQRQAQEKHKNENGYLLDDEENYEMF